jgi:hypothetical protein
MDNGGVDTQYRYDEHRERPPDPVHEHRWTPVHERQWTSTDSLVDVLREQLQRAQERERAYEERERAYQDHIARLTAMLHDAHQQNQRLLDMPRSAPVPGPGLRAPAAPEGSRGDMRRRIVALLQDHPEGLSPAQVRRLLAVDKDLGATMKAMARDGLIRRVQTGWYLSIPCRAQR